VDIARCYKGFIKTLKLSEKRRIFYLHESRLSIVLRVLNINTHTQTSNCVRAVFICLFQGQVRRVSETSSEYTDI
jgi:hypothetical protein